MSMLLLEKKRDRKAHTYTVKFAKINIRGHLNGLIG